MNIQEMNQAFECAYIQEFGEIDGVVFFNGEKYELFPEARGFSEFHLVELKINAAWTMWQQAIKNAVPDWAVIAPRLSANYLYSKVPELGFKSQDEKETVLYHLNYMASEFKEDAKKFVIDDHEKQKEFCNDIDGPGKFSSEIQQDLKAEIKRLKAEKINVVLFPKEPTKELYTAFHEAFSAAGTGRTVDNFRAGYGAMVAFIHGNEGQ